MKHLICSAVLLLGAQVPAWAEENAGVPTPEQLAEEEKKMTAEEEQGRRGSPLVVYDKRGGPAKPAEAKAEKTAARDTGAKGFNFNMPSGGGSGAGGSGGGGRGKGGPASPTASGAPGGGGAAPGGGGPEKNRDGACERGGWRENAKDSPYKAPFKCQMEKLEGNKQLRNATGLLLAPIVPAPLLKNQMDKLK